MKSFLAGEGRRGNGSSGGRLSVFPGRRVSSGRRSDLQNGVLRMVWTAAVYGLEYASVILHDRNKIRDRFWNCTGTTVFLMMMGAFYSDPSLALWNMDSLYGGI